MVCAFSASTARCRLKAACRLWSAKKSSARLAYREARARRTASARKPASNRACGRVDGKAGVGPLEFRLRLAERHVVDHHRGMAVGGSADALVCELVFGLMLGQHELERVERDRLRIDTARFIAGFRRF